MNAFGPERSITLCRELTKLHEEIWKTTLGEAQAHYAANEPRASMFWSWLVRQLPQSRKQN
mgnify:CR=1 FL=1